MGTFSRALVAFAHPDDAEFTCGGTVARWVQDGTEVSYVCVTDGSAGWNGADRSRDEIARIREDELRAAAGILGVRSVTMLGWADGSLTADLALRRALTAAVRRIRPDVIVTQDPSQLWSRDRTYINHPDHKAVGEAILAVVACDAPTRPQFPELLEEGLEPYEVPALWLSTAPSEADTHVDIGETMDLKVKALEAHESQMQNMKFDADTRLREYASKTGRRAGLAYAEAFRTFRLKDEG